MGGEEVSVIVPYYGVPGDALALVRQLQHQQTHRRVQIIVVDDASPIPFPQIAGIELVQRDRNGGFAAAVNSGLDVVQGAQLLVMNSDVTVSPTFVDDLLAAAEPVWPAVVSPRVVEDFGERCVGHFWPTRSAVFLEQLVPLARWHGQRWFEHRTSNIVESVGINEPMRVDWVTGICLLMPTEDVRAVGGLDERYFMNCEEIDLQKRLHDERRLPAVVVPAPVIEHLGGGSSPSDKQAGWVLDARVRYFEKWGGGTALHTILLMGASVNLAWNSARRLAGRDVRPLVVFKRERRLIEKAWRTRR